MPGIEEITWLEIRDKLPYVKFGEYLFAKEQNGIVTFSYTGEVADLHKLASSESEFLQALSLPKLSRSRRDLAAIRDAVAKGEELGRATNQLMRYRQLSRPPSYRVISRTFGAHDYRVAEVERAVLQGMQARYPRWTPVLDGPQVELWVNLLGSHLLCGYRITDKKAKRAHKLRDGGTGGLRPSVAAAMIQLTQPEKDDWFLDPFCGNGILLHERKLAGPFAHLWGAAIDVAQISLTERNLTPRRKRSLPPTISLATWVDNSLPLEAGSVDKIATSLLGMRGVKITAVFREISRALRAGGTAVVLSSEYDKIKNTLRSLPNLEITTGYSVKPGARWGRIYIIKKIRD